MPETFSSTESFRRSYFLKMRLNMGMTFTAMKISRKPRMMDTTTYTTAMEPPVTKAMTMANTSIMGLLMATRMIIMYAICTLLVSVVRRVTSELVEKRSMLENENRWMFWNMSCRRFFAKPVAATEQVMPALAPHASDTRARMMRIRL